MKVRNWNKVQMEKAIVSVRNNQMGIKIASKTFEVPHTTLQRMARSDKSIDELLSIRLGRKPVLDQETEEELVTYLQDMESRFWGLTRKDIRSLAFQIAQKTTFQTNLPFCISVRVKIGFTAFYKDIKKN